MDESMLHNNASSNRDDFHMSPDEFRRHGHALVDWIAEYWERVESMPVLSQATPGQIRDALPASPPMEGEPFEVMLKDVEEVILPGITHWQSPNFFAFFPANTSGPSVLGEMLSAGLGVQGMLWATSPACTELEVHVLDWVAEMLDLPESFRSSGTGGGVIQDSASSSALCAMLAARHRINSEVEEGATLIAYASSEAHSSIEKAAMIAGIGRGNLRLIGVDIRSQCGQGSWPHAFRRIERPGACRFSPVRPWGRPLLLPSTLYQRLLASAERKVSGSTSMRPWPAPQPYAPSSAPFK